MYIIGSTYPAGPVLDRLLLNYTSRRPLARHDGRELEISGDGERESVIYARRTLKILPTLFFLVGHPFKVTLRYSFVSFFLPFGPIVNRLSSLLVIPVLRR